MKTCKECNIELFEKKVFNLGMVLYGCKNCLRVYVECQDIISDDANHTIYESYLLEFPNYRSNPLVFH